MNRLRCGVGLAIALLATGCAKQSDLVLVQQRVQVLETEHGKTRAKLDSLLYWANGRTTAPKNIGVQKWIEATHDKVWVGGPTDPVKPSQPPPPF